MTEQNDTSRVVLVATDGSSTAQGAINVAVHIARSLDLEIRGLSVVNETLMLNPYADYDREFAARDQPTSHDELLDSLKQRGREALDWLEERCQAENVPVSTDLILGGVPETIIHQARGVGMLALGRRGHGHSDDSGHLGSNFLAVAHQAHQPIAVGGDAVRPLRRLLVAYNGRENAQRALSWAARLQQSLPSRLIVLGVQEAETDQAEEWLEDARGRLASGDTDGMVFLQRAGQLAAQIAAVAQENQVDLIVIGRRGHSALHEWLVGSTANRVLRSTNLATLIV